MGSGERLDITIVDFGLFADAVKAAIAVTLRFLI